MKKILYIVTFFWWTGVSLFGQTSFDILNGKTFIREVSSVCKSFKDGGCLITTYHTLAFDNNTVVLAYEVIADCDNLSQNVVNDEKGVISTFVYQIHKKRNSPNYIIRVNGYNGFEVFPDKLIELPPINSLSYSEEDKITFELKK